jgi:hypothetical protein
LFIRFGAPRGGKPGQPGKGFFEHGGVERVADVLAILFREDETGLAEEIEVIGNARETDAEVAGDLADGEVALAQQFEDAAADRIIQRAEEPGHILR